MAFLEANGVTKRYGSVLANAGLSFMAERGRITALLGENGAGKTTLARILAGEERADSGEVFLDGKALSKASRRETFSSIGLVHQHPLLAEELSVSENLALGREPLRGLVFLDRKRMLMKAAAAAGEFGFKINPDALVRDLSPSERQEAEILKVLTRGVKAIILDEPTSLLAREEAESLYRLLRRLAQAGKAVIVVTHRLSELRFQADRFVFLRDGMNAGESASFDESFALRAMFGSDGGDEATARGSERRADARGREGRGRAALRAIGLGREGLEFTAYRSEILAFVALAGNGLEELEHILSGHYLSGPGRLFLGDTDLGRLPTGGRRKAGMAYLPTDRLRRGVNPRASVAENLLALEGRSVFRFPGKTKEEVEKRARAKDAVLRVEGDLGRPAGTLSGGQTQAIALNREVSSPCELLLACNPGWGLDNMARGRALRALANAKEAGACVLLLSSDLEEALEIADRIIVLYRGRIALETENRGSAPLEDAIAKAMIGAQ